MRIGLLAPPLERVPPVTYGGTERVIATLADALVDRGHDVTLFASGDSDTRARLVPTVERAIWHDPQGSDPLPVWMLAIERAYGHAGELDVMHDHSDVLALPAARRAPVPTVTTLHRRLDRPEVTELLRAFPEHPFVSVSDAQRRPIPDARWIATVHHGYPREHYRPSFAPGSYLAFCGRLSREKGIECAIDVARRTGLPLKVAARRPRSDLKEQDLRAEWAYWETTVRGIVDREPLVEYLGELTEPEKQDLYAGAIALLFPVDWPEPFGLVMIEALACGTPVLARPRGSVPEIVRDGVTGFHCETAGDFTRAVERIATIDRRACRRDFEERFTADVMATRYEAVFREVAGMPETFPLASAGASS